MLQPSRTEGNEDILESPTFDLDFYGLLAIKKVIVGSMVCDPDLGTKDLDWFFFFFLTQILSDYWSGVCMCV